MKFKLLTLLLSFIAFNCSKDTTPAPAPPPAVVPTISATAVVGNITSTTASSGGTISTDGGATITARGVCWSTSVNPVLSGPHTTDGTGTGTFTSTITGLTPNTRYYVRAYASNSAGTAYGAEINFTTSPGSAGLPSLTTTAITSITTTTAASGGDISGDGGAPVSARGVCWSTTPNPIATGNHTTDGAGTGTFTSAITGLTPLTTYFVRAYATNSVGTAYGNELSFTSLPTAPVLPTVSTTAITSVTASSAISGGNVTGAGGGIVTARGVCWSTSMNPTISGSHTIDGAGTGVFTSTITGLTGNTTYFVRAYATNSLGTGYGSQLSFTTQASPPVDVYIAGFEFDGSRDIPKYWKNGIATPLPYSTQGGGIGTGVFVSGTDVYVSGSDSTRAAYWKNGVRTDLSPGPQFGEANSVFISGSDVYIGGFYGSSGWIPTVWKNNVPTHLPGGGVSAANSVFVSGTDVYAAGFETNGSFITAATLWKNGVRTYLTGGTTNALASSVYVAGTDVYVAGYENNGTINVAKVWKNGVATILGTGTSRARSVFVSGTDVYVAGYEYNATVRVAKYWKNGIATPLTSGTNDAIAESIFILGSDIYVAGIEQSGANYKVMLWKNGVATPITSGSFNAGGKSIFVK